MEPQKIVEILQINLQENERKMPPDVKTALTFAIGSVYHIILDHGGIIPKPAAAPDPQDPQTPS